MATTQEALAGLETITSARDKYLLQKRRAHDAAIARTRYNRQHHVTGTTKDGRFIPVGKVGLQLRATRIPGMRLPAAATRDAWHNKDKARS